MCCHGNSESFHKWRLRTKGTHQESPRNRSTKSTSTDFGKSSLYAEILQILLLFSMIWYCRIQSPALSKQRDVRWCGFAIWFRYQLPIFGLSVLIWLSRLLHAHIAYAIDTYNIIAAFFRISFVCLIWYTCIQSFAMIKQQDIRWCSFRGSIPLSFAYVCNVYIDTAISTP